MGDHKHASKLVIVPSTMNFIPQRHAGCHIAMNVSQDAQNIAPRILARLQGEHPQL
jgi:hypothetical protein